MARYLLIAFILSVSFLNAKTLRFSSKEERVVAYQVGISHLDKGKSLLEKAEQLRGEGNTKDSRDVASEAVDNFNEAKGIFEEVSEEDASASVLMSLAETYWLLQDTENALATYKKIVDEVAPENEAALVQLGKIYYHYIGDNGSSKVYFTRALKADKEEPEALFYLGYIAYNEDKNFEEAQKYFERVNALSSMGQNYKSYSEYYLGVINAYKHRYTEALTLLQKVNPAYLSDQEQVIYYAYLSECYQVKEEYEKSLEAYLPLKQIRAGNATVLYQLALLNELADKSLVPIFKEIDSVSTEYTSKPYFITALKARKESPNQTIRMLSSYISENPKELAAYQLFYDVVCEEEATNFIPIASLALSYAYYLHGVYDMSAKHLQSNINMGGGEELYYDLARAYMGDFLTNDAVNALKIYLGANIKHTPSKVLETANFLSKIKEFSLAILAYDLLPTNENTSYPIIAVNKALLYAQNNNENMARTMISNALIVDEKTADSQTLENLFYITASVYSILDETNAAVNYYKKTLSINSSNFFALNGLGYTYIDLDIDIEEGIKLVKQSLLINPHSPEALDSLAWGYYKLNDYTNSKQILIQAIELSGDDVSPVLYEHLADVYLSMNNTEEALEYYKKSLYSAQRGVDFNEAKVRQKISKLKNED